MAVGSVSGGLTRRFDRLFGRVFGAFARRRHHGNERKPSSSHHSAFATLRHSIAAYSASLRVCLAHCPPPACFTPHSVLHTAHSPLHYLSSACFTTASTRCTNTARRCIALCRAIATCGTLRRLPRACRTAASRRHAFAA